MGIVEKSSIRKAFSLAQQPILDLTNNQPQSMLCG
jgi:hypothetical protein